MKKVFLFFLIAFYLCVSCSKKSEQEPDVAKPDKQPSSVDAQTEKKSGPRSTITPKYVAPVEFAKPGELDEKPAPLRVIRPSYPTELYMEGIEGSATLVFVVNEFGQVEDIQTESCTDSLFADYASDALMHWRFPIPRKDGQPVKVRMRLKFPFVMDSESTPSNTQNTALPSESSQP